MIFGFENPSFLAGSSVDSHRSQGRRGEVHKPVNDDRVAVHIGALVGVSRAVFPCGLQMVDIGCMDIGELRVLSPFFVPSIDGPICEIVIGISEGEVEPEGGDDERQAKEGVEKKSSHRKKSVWHKKYALDGRAACPQAAKMGQRSLATEYCQPYQKPSQIFKLESLDTS